MIIRYYTCYISFVGFRKTSLRLTTKFFLLILVELQNLISNDQSILPNLLPSGIGLMLPENNNRHNLAEY